MTVGLRIHSRRPWLAPVAACLVVIACSTSSVAFHGAGEGAGNDVTVSDTTGNLLDVDFQPDPQLPTPIEAGMGQFPNRPTRYGIWWTVTDDCDGVTSLAITRSGQSVSLDLLRPRCDGPNPRTTQLAIEVRQPFDMQWTTFRVLDN